MSAPKDVIRPYGFVVFDAYNERNLVPSVVINPTQVKTVDKVFNRDGTVSATIEMNGGRILELFMCSQEEAAQEIDNAMRERLKMQENP